MQRTTASLPSSIPGQIFVKNGSRIALTKLITLKRHFQNRSLKIFSHVASMQLMVPGLLVLAAVFLHAAEQELPLLRKQLQAAETASDNPAIVELSRRIVETDPADSKTGEN